MPNLPAAPSLPAKSFLFEIPALFTVRLVADNRPEAKMILDQLFGKKTFPASHVHNGVAFKLKLNA